MGKLKLFLPSSMHFFSDFLLQWCVTDKGTSLLDSWTPTKVLSPLSKINVLWGDDGRKPFCYLADVTPWNLCSK